MNFVETYSIPLGTPLPFPYITQSSFNFTSDISPFLLSLPFSFCLLDLRLTFRPPIVISTAGRNLIEKLLDARSLTS